MKIKTFEIPTGNMIEFADLLIDNELSNEITGTADDKIIIEVQYESHEREAVFDISEWVENTVLGDEE